MKRNLGKRLQSWSVIVFCYNEKVAVRNTVERVKRVLDRIAGERNEIVLVDDGSTDGSAQVIREIALRFRGVKALYHPANRGIGAALRTGYAAARHENVCAIPADGQFDPEELLPFSFVEKKTFVSFFRKKQTGYGLFRKLLSIVNKVINRVFLGIRLRDVNWVKIYKGKELSRLDLRLQSSLIESEICAKLTVQGNKAIEIPSVYHRRTSGRERGGSLKIVWTALNETYRLIRVVWSYKNRLGK